MKNLPSRPVFSALVFVILLFPSLPVARAETVPFGCSPAQGFFQKISELSPGQKVLLKLRISMNAPVDAFFKLDISNQSGTPDLMSPTNIKNWIRFPKGADISVLGKSKGETEAIIPLEITLPKVIAPGDYLANLSCTLDTSRGSSASKNGAGVQISPAISLDLAFSVKGKRVYKLNFDTFEYIGLSSHSENGLMTPHINLSFGYSSRGNAIIRSVARIQALNMFGEAFFSKEYNLTDTMPSLTGATQVMIPPLAEGVFGWYTLQSEILYSALDSSGNPLKETLSAGTKSVRIYTISWVPVSLILFCLLGILSFFLYRFFRLRSLRARSVAYEVREGDTLQSICTQQGCQASDVIFVNHLKPPYFVTPRSTLLLPRLPSP